MDRCLICGKKNPQISVPIPVTLPCGNSAHSYGMRPAAAAQSPLKSPAQRGPSAAYAAEIETATRRGDWQLPPPLLFVRDGPTGRRTGPIPALPVGFSSKRNFAARIRRSPKVQICPEESWKRILLWDLTASRTGRGTASGPCCAKRGSATFE